MKTNIVILLLLLTVVACRQEVAKAPDDAPNFYSTACDAPPDTLEVLGYYNLDSCSVQLNIQAGTDGKWCYLPEGKFTTAPCPGWEAFIVLLQERDGLFIVEMPFEVINPSGLPIQLWMEPDCPYPGSFDNGGYGAFPGNRYYAMMRLSEDFLNCLLRREGFYFRLQVVQKG